MKIKDGINLLSDKFNKALAAEDCCSFVDEVLELEDQDLICAMYYCDYFGEHSFYMEYSMETEPCRRSDSTDRSVIDDLEFLRPSLFLDILIRRITAGQDAETILEFKEAILKDFKEHKQLVDNIRKKFEEKDFRVIFDLEHSNQS
jgi:hypothetical protein